MAMQSTACARGANSTSTARAYDYYSLAAAEAMGLTGVARLPYTLKVVLENLLRQHAEGTATTDDIAAVTGWLNTRSSEREIGFKPTRVLMVDSSGIPLMGDMAAMRDAMVRLGGDPRRINPAVPVDFIIDHGVMVDSTRSARRAAAQSAARNRAQPRALRFSALGRARVRQPAPDSAGQGHLPPDQPGAPRARRVDARSERCTLAYPDSVLGMDSHTPMISSLGIVGWGVGGLEGGTATLGEPVAMLIPEVIGCRLTGKPPAGVTTTDIVLTITQTLRKHKLIAAFVEYFGPGVDALALPERSTISNMTPEYGATMGFFRSTRKRCATCASPAATKHRSRWSKRMRRRRACGATRIRLTPDYTRMVEIDLSCVEPSIAGPRRPHERVPLPDAPAAFRRRLSGEGTCRHDQGRRHHDRRDRELHQHLESVRDDRRRAARPERRGARLEAAATLRPRSLPARESSPTISRRAGCTRRSTRSGSSSPATAA